MFVMILFLLLLVLFLYYPLHDIYLIYVKGGPPGPISLPIIGSLHLMSPTTPHLSLEKLYKKYGPIFSLRIGPFFRGVFVGNLTTIDEIFTKPEVNNRPNLPFIDLISKDADGIGSCDFGSEKWKYLMRALTQGQKQFSNANLTTQVIPYFKQLIERLDANTDKSYHPRNDIAKVCSAIFSSILYGIKTESLDSDDLVSRMKYHDTIMSGLNPAHILNMMPFVWMIPSPMKSKIQECVKHRDNMMEEYLQRHIDQFDGEYRDMMDIVANSILHHATLIENNETTVKDLLMSLWTFYLAGCDTSVDSMSWMLLYLCQYKEVQTKVKEELDSVLSDKNDDILDKKAHLHYTRAFVLESLRLSSPIALGIPHCSSKDTQLSGYFIPKETLILPTQWTIHHDQAHWPEPNELIPERFLDKDGSLLALNYIFKRMPFIPFSRGIRTCMGQYLALDLLLIFVCIIVQNYDLNFPENHVPDLNGKIVLGHRPNELKVVFRKR